MESQKQKPPTRWRLALILSLVWVLIGLLFATQLVVFDSMPLSAAAKLASVDWLPWILLSPLILWLGTRCEITSETWMKAVPLHLIACVLVTFMTELIFRTAIDVGYLTMRPRMGMSPMDNGGPMPPPEAERFQESMPLWMALSRNKNNAENSATNQNKTETRQESMQPPEDPGRYGFGGPGQRGFGGPRMGSASLLRTPRARMTMPLYWVLIAAAHAAAYHRRSLERERRALIAEAKLAEARMAMLQSQINPHFLFNTLNTIAQYVHEDPEATEQMIEDLAKLLRASLAASETRQMSLEEELSLARTYLGIQQKRFPDRLSVEWHIAPETLHIRVPTLALQPLIENAVIHGIAPQKTPGRLLIRSYLDKGTLLVDVIDTGDGRGRERKGEAVTLRREGIGIQNTRARIRALYGAQAELSLTWDEFGGVRSRVSIPVETLAPQEKA